jgi:hypothetical protein
VIPDTPSQIPSHNDPRAQPGQDAADLGDLVDALKTRGMMARLDDTLMPQGDFIPREFPGKSEFPGTIIFSNHLTSQKTRLGLRLYMTNMMAAFPCIL